MVHRSDFYTDMYEVSSSFLTSFSRHTIAHLATLLTGDVTVFSRSVVTPDLTVCSLPVQSYLAP